MLEYAQTLLFEPLLQGKFNENVKLDNKSIMTLLLCSKLGKFKEKLMC